MKSSTPDETKNEPSNKMRKITSEIVDADKVVLTDIKAKLWLSLKGIELTETHKTMIISGEMLSDMHINYAQEILKMQFHHVTGLQLGLDGLC